jgi:hypothetical protein
MQTDAYQYIPPNETTHRRHSAIRSAELACSLALKHALSLHIVDSHGKDHGSLRATPADFAAVSDACRAFSVVCAAVAPRSADLAAAERCVRLARMLSNEALGCTKATRADHLFALALDELTKARMQACAAVALADADELPPVVG